MKSMLSHQIQKLHKPIREDAIVLKESKAPKVKEKYQNAPVLNQVRRSITP
jgi:hypothetical protein